MATKFQREDIRGRTSKVTQSHGDAPPVPVKRPGRRPMVQILALLAIISALAVVDGVQRRNRLRQEGLNSAVGEVLEKRSRSTEEPASGHELVLRLSFPEEEHVVVSTEVDRDTWASLNPGDRVRVLCTPGPEVGTLDIRLIELFPEGTPTETATPAPQRRLGDG